MTVTVTTDVTGVLAIVEGLPVALEELCYRLDELDDTGDYEQEDLDRMTELVEAIRHFQSTATFVAIGGDE